MTEIQLAPNRYSQITLQDAQGPGKPRALTAFETNHCECERYSDMPQDSKQAKERKRLMQQLVLA